MFFVGVIGCGVKEALLRVWVGKSKFVYASEI